MYTLTNLPADGHLYVFATADRWAPEDVEHGAPSAAGWVDVRWSRTEIYRSRNDVNPLWDGPVWAVLRGRGYGNGYADTPEDVRTEIFDAIRDYLGAVGSDNSRGTLCAADSESDFTTGDTYSRAVHVSVKHRVDGQWREDDVHIPAEDVNAR